MLPSNTFQTSKGSEVQGIFHSNRAFLKSNSFKLPKIRSINFHTPTISAFNKKKVYDLREFFSTCPPPLSLVNTLQALNYHDTSNIIQLDANEISTSPWLLSWPCNLHFAILTFSQGTARDLGSSPVHWLDPKTLDVCIWWRTMETWYISISTRSLSLVLSCNTNIHRLRVTRSIPKHSDHRAWQCINTSNRFESIRIRIAFHSSKEQIRCLNACVHRYMIGPCDPCLWVGFGTSHLQILHVLTM